jgi:predicted phage gp36 major capsid-like protein
MLPEVTTMPRTAQEILDHADELAARFETHEPGDDIHDATELRLVREAFLARADAERVLGDAVVRARHSGHSWASIGAMVGTSGEAARQRYGQSVNAS